MEDYLKVRLEVDSDVCSCEWVWAKPVTGNLVCIQSIPLFSNGIGKDDIVEVSGKGPFRNFVRVVKHVTDTVAISYDKSRAKEIYPQIAKYFREQGICVEGMVAGIAVLAVPIDVTSQQLEHVIRDCPVSVALHQETQFKMR